MKRAEKIIAHGLFGAGGAVYIVPNKQLAMDFWNEGNKTYENWSEKCTTDTCFVTSNGNVVNASEAFDIAFNAGQLTQFRNKGALCATDIWK